MSGSKIDKFIHAMYRKSAEELLFGTGKPVRIMVDGAEHVVLDKAVASEQIDKLVIPILTEDEAETFRQDGDAAFDYSSPDGRVHIESRRRGPKLAVRISPSTGDTAQAPVVVGPDHGAEAEPERPSADALFDDEPPPRSASVAGRATIMSGPPAAMAAGDGGSRPSAAALKSTLGASGKHISPNTSGAPINKILTVLAKSGGSDLHLTTGQRPRMRKDGEIMEIPGWEEVLTSDLIQSWMFDVANDHARKNFEESNDADYAHEVKDVARFRMNIFRDRNGVGAVMRTIPSKVLTADQLNLPPVIRSFCTLPKGLVTVTGPTGSGKSTTLAAMIDLINKSRTDHIITIEDPVEFVHKSIKCLINQREVHSHTESFGRALRAALREDPDIVLVGEMRDLETVHIAIETAETGHLVFGTLHTNTAASTVDRIIDQFPTDRQSQIRVMLSETLKGVVAQTLCKKLGGGRAAVLEILVCTNAIANLIREGKTFQIQSMMQTGKNVGMQTQTDAMLQLIRDGIISPAESIAKAVDGVVMKAAVERYKWDPSSKEAVPKEGEAMIPDEPAQPAQKPFRR